jgi:hypothetical protein
MREIIDTPKQWYLRFISTDIDVLTVNDKNAAEATTVFLRDVIVVW